jgi:hypothetical protein
METEIIITNMLATGTAFAVRSDDMNESVFVPSKHAVNAGLKPGQKVTAQIVPNVAHGDKTPWIVIAISGAEPLPQPTLADRIRAELEIGPATTMELCKALGVGSQEVVEAARKMKLPHDDLWALEMVDLLQVAE